MPTREIHLTFTSQRPYWLRDSRKVKVMLTGYPDMSRRFLKRRSGAWLHLGPRAFHVGVKIERL